MGTGNNGVAARRIRKPSDVTLVSELLTLENWHDKAVNGLNHWVPERIRKLLEEAKAKSSETLVYSVLALMSLRNGGIRFKNRERAWLDLVPRNMLSDFGADAFCFRELLNIAGVANSDDVKSAFTGRTLDPVLFETLRSWNFNMPAVVQSLYELSQLVQGGFAFKLPSRESFDQRAFTSCFAKALSQLDGVFVKAEKSGEIQSKLESSDRFCIEKSIIHEILEDNELVLIDALSSSCMITMRQDAGSALEEGQDFLAVLKSALASDSDYYRVKLDELPDEASLYRSWVPAQKAATQPQAVSVVAPATSAPAPTQIELIDLPEVPEALRAFSQLQASLDNLTAINVQLRKLQGAEAAAKKATELEAQIQALDKRLQDLHEEEQRLHEERAHLAEVLHQQHQDACHDALDPKALRAQGQKIASSIETFVQSAQALSMA